jgi:uncharacterized protein
MTGETDLKTLLRTMRPVLAEGVHVFVTLPPDAVPGDLTPRMRFDEDEGTTLILLRSQAEAHGLPCHFPCRMITLRVHSSLAAVGFIARIATALAAAGMGVNPVSGFYHDHLFVPEDRADEAMQILRRLAADA